MKFLKRLSIFTTLMLIMVFTLNYFGFCFKEFKFLSDDEFIANYAGKEELSYYERINRNYFTMYELKENPTMDEVAFKIKDIVSSHSDRQSPLDLTKKLKDIYTIKDITKDSVGDDISWNITDELYGMYKKTDNEEDRSISNWGMYRDIKYQVGRAVMTNIHLYPKDAFEVEKSNVSFIDRILGKNNRTINIKHFDFLIDYVNDDKSFNRIDMLDDDLDEYFNTPQDISFYEYDNRMKHNELIILYSVKNLNNCGCKFRIYRAFKNLINSYKE